MHYGSKAWENICKSFSYLLIMGLIRGFWPHKAIFSILISRGPLSTSSRYHINLLFKKFSTSGVITCDPYVKWINSNLSWNIAVTFENSKIDLVLSLHLILYIKLHFTPFVAILWPRTIWILRLTWGSKSYIHASTDR